MQCRARARRRAALWLSPARQPERRGPGPSGGAVPARLGACDLSASLSDSGLNLMIRAAESDTVTVRVGHCDWLGNVLSHCPVTSQAVRRGEPSASGTVPLCTIVPVTDSERTCLSVTSGWHRDTRLGG